MPPSRHHARLMDDARSAVDQSLRAVRAARTTRAFTDAAITRAAALIEESRELLRRSRTPREG